MTDTTTPETPEFAVLAHADMARLAETRPTAWAEEVSRPVHECDAFVLVIPEEIPFTESIECRLQLATAIALDKPIAVVAPASVSVPEQLQKVADRVCFYRDGNHADLANAMRRATSRSRR